MGNGQSGDIVQGKSKVGGNTGVFDADKMFKDGWWLNYCFCGGRVVGDFGNPLLASEGKQLCEHATCELTGIGGSKPEDPYCADVSACLCFSTECNFPKVEGSPTCAICNKVVAGGDTSGWKHKLFEYEMKWDHQFWLYYLMCMGEALHMPAASGKPLLGMERKMLCIKEGMQCVQLSEEGIFCASLGTALCFWDQCQFPPRAGNPKFACCNVIRIDKSTQASSGIAPMSYGKSA